MGWLINRLAVDMRGSRRDPSFSAGVPGDASSSSSPASSSSRRQAFPSLVSPPPAIPTLPHCSAGCDLGSPALAPAPAKLTTGSSKSHHHLTPPQGSIAVLLLPTASNCSAFLIPDVLSEDLRKRYGFVCCRLRPSVRPCVRACARPSTCVAQL